MQPEDVQKAIDSAVKWVGEKMTTADLVAVASISSGLQVLTDFTSDKERLRAVLSRIRRDRRHGVYRRRTRAPLRPTKPRTQRPRPPPMRAFRNSTRSTTTSGCAR